MFEKSFGPQWEEVTEYWRKLRSFLLILNSKYLRVMLQQYQKMKKRKKEKKEKKKIDAV
jgi:hypothetical protein